MEHGGHTVAALHAELCHALTPVMATHQVIMSAFACVEMCSMFAPSKLWMALDESPEFDQIHGTALYFDVQRLLHAPIAH